MTNYQNAANGIKKIFKSEILELISVVLVGLAIIFGIVFLAATSDAVKLALSIPTLIFGLAAGVLGVIALVFQLLGLKQASNENESFKYALFAAIAAIALKMIATILSSIFKDVTMVSTLSNSVSKLVDLFITYYIIKGCVELNIQKNNEDLVERGTTVLTRVLIAYAIALLLNVIPAFVSSTIGIISMVFSIICSIIAYIQFLMFLKATGDSLAKED